ncbi:MAG: stalk domain-containing protein [Syntrophomonadaceae bacterium]|jgi:uncharacterized repeat protein (TIGR02543 family)
MSILNRMLPLIAGVIIVLALLCLGGGSALAADVEDEAELRAALTGSDAVINVVGDITLTNFVYIDREVTVTSDAYAIDTGEYYININGDGDLTVEGDLTLKGSCTRCGVITVNGGTFNFDSGTISSKDGLSNGIDVFSGIANISGGTISGTDYGVYIDGGTANISGGAIEAEETGVYVTGGEANISGGNISGAYYSVRVDGGTTTVSSGIIGSSPDSGDGVCVWGGTVLIEGGVVSGYHGVSVYGGTVTISGDAEIEPSGHSSCVFINYNKFAEAGTTTISGGTINAIFSCEGVEVQSGIVDISGGAITVENGPGVYVTGGEANISGGTITATGAWSKGIDVGSGTANIDGGTISGGSIGIYIDEDCTAVITGGSISGGNIGVSVEKGKAEIAGSAQITGGDYGLNVSLANGEANISGGTIEATNEYGIGVYVAIYSTAAISGGTIDATGKFGIGVNIDENSTVSISGGTIKATGEYGKAVKAEEYSIVNVSGSAEIRGEIAAVKSSTVDISGGTVAATGDYETAVKADESSIVNVSGSAVIRGGIVAENSSTVDISGGTITVASETYAGIFLYISTAEISGGTITASGNLGYGVYACDSTVDISGATIKATGENSKGVFICNGGKVNISVSADLTIEGGVYKLNFEGLVIPFLTELPRPVTMTAGETETVTLAGLDAIISFKIDIDNTSAALAASISGNMVTLQPAVAAIPDTYTMALTAVNGLNFDTLNLTIPVTVQVPTYTVTYDGNGKTGGSEPTDGSSYEKGVIVTVLGNTGSLVKTGCTFAGWNTQADGNGTSYAAGATFTMGTANVTLYARWTKAGGSGSGGSGDDSGGGSPAPKPATATSKEIRAASGGTVSLGGVSVNIPAGALPGDATISIKKLTPGEADNIIPEGLRLKLGSDTYEITTTGERDFGDNTITIKIPYDPGKIAAGEVPAINYYDDETGEWTALETTVEQGPDGKWYAVVRVNHLTKFAVFSTAVQEPVQPPKVIKLTIGSTEATIDGEPYTLDAAPFIKPEVSRTLVPLRFLGEALGATVDWTAETQQVSITDAGSEITLTIDSQEALVNSAPVNLDCPAELHPPGRTFVPLRFVSETLGAQVDWDGATKMITIIR